MEMAASRSSVGARPLAWISDCCEAFQLLFVARTEPSLLCNSITGSCNAPGIGAPLLRRDGPMPRTITFFFDGPRMMNPPIITSFPRPVRKRVELFKSVEEKKMSVRGGVLLDAPIGVRPYISVSVRRTL